MPQFTIKIGNAFRISFSKAKEKWRLLTLAHKIFGLLASIATVALFVYNFFIVG